MDDTAAVAALVKMLADHPMVSLGLMQDKTVAMLVEQIMVVAPDRLTIERAPRIINITSCDMVLIFSAVWLEDDTWHVTARKDMIVRD